MLPSFYVRDIPIYGDAILSPMTGYSDVPYRAICRAYGSAMNYTEFVPVEALLGKHNRFWTRLDRRPGEYPLTFQIFGNSAPKILEAAVRIEGELGPDIIDINMGCSTRQVSGRGAGVGMMRDPALVAETFAALSRHLRVPITAKMRLGWDEQINFMEIGRIAVDNGAQLIALHGRTKEQKYGGRANWDAIAALKQALPVPVIGNGDVRQPSQIDEMKAYTGCDAVMIGRGAIGNPWIFARQRRTDLTVADLFAAVRRHAQEMADYHGEAFGLLQFRKHLKRYMAGMVELEAHLPALLQCKETAVFMRLLAEAEGELPPTLPLREAEPDAAEEELTCEV
ncbi:MAG: tRNA-dihydrouridine synthase [Chloroflexi bacterium]|nr:tRNA-dihydrouridine synthase [Chloroflexota bacterium]